jgi:hypothetical protein
LPIQDNNKIYVPKNDNREDKGKEKEVINVDSDKIEEIEFVAASQSINKSEFQTQYS